MSDCKQMQVRLKNGKYINLERKKHQANMLQNRFEIMWVKAPENPVLNSVREI